MRLPDRFDLAVRKIRTTADTHRQIDILLGALLAQKTLFLWNIGTQETPAPAISEIEGTPAMIVFSDALRLSEAMDNYDSDSSKRNIDSTGLIALTSDHAFATAIALNTALLVNPLSGEDTFYVSKEHLEPFYNEWRASVQSQALGFWIPNITTEEEDFWQEQGL